MKKEQILLWPTPIQYLEQTVDGQDIFKIINEDQDQYVFFRILLPDRRGKKIVLGIIVDHGLGQDLVLLVAPGRGELRIHEGGHLIHIQVNIRNIIRMDIVDPGKAF